MVKNNFKKFYDELEVHDIDNLIDYALNKSPKFCYFIAKYDEATEIVREVIKKYNVTPEYIDLQEPCYNNYCEEFLISVDFSDVNEYGLLSCETLYSKEHKRYIYFDIFEDESVYIMENCNHKALGTTPSSNVTVVIFDSNELDDIDDYCDCDKDCSCYCDCVDKADLSGDYNNIDVYVDFDDNNKLSSFTKTCTETNNGSTITNSYSFSCNNEDLVKEYAKKFGIEL